MCFNLDHLQTVYVICNHYVIFPLIYGLLLKLQFKVCCMRVVYAFVVSKLDRHPNSYLAYLPCKILHGLLSSAAPIAPDSILK